MNGDEWWWTVVNGDERRWTVMNGDDWWWTVMISDDRWWSVMMITVGPFGTRCSDMFQIMFENGCHNWDGLTDGRTQWRTEWVSRVAIRNWKLDNYYLTIFHLPCCKFTYPTLKLGDSHPNPRLVLQSRVSHITEVSAVQAPSSENSNETEGSPWIQNQRPSFIFKNGQWTMRTMRKKGQSSHWLTLRSCDWMLSSHWLTWVSSTSVISKGTNISVEEVLVLTDTFSDPVEVQLDLFQSLRLLQSEIKSSPTFSK